MIPNPKIANPRIRPSLLRRVVEIRVPRKAVPLANVRQGQKKIFRQTFRARVFLRALRRSLLLRVDPMPPGCFATLEVVLYEWYYKVKPEAYLRIMTLALVPGIMRDATVRYLRGASIRCERHPGKMGFVMRLWIYEGDVPPASVAEAMEPGLECLAKRTGKWASRVMADDLAERLEKTIVDVDRGPLDAALAKNARKKHKRLY